MLKVKIELVEGACDACKNPLNRTLLPDGSSNVHYGSFQNEFGYGSPLDHLAASKEKYEVCEACWTKALSSIGLAPH